MCSEHLADSFKNVFDAYSESVNRSIFYFISHNCKRCVIRCSFQLHSKSFSWCSSTTCMWEALGLQSWPLNLAHLLGLPYTCYYYPWPRVLPRVMEHYVLGVIPRPCIHDTRHDAGTESIVTSIAATVFGFASLLFSPPGVWKKVESRRYI